MKISVIIPAFNEERLISKSIAAVQATEISISDYEIIVVNNGSTDRTAEIASNFGVILLNSDRRFVGAARNLGAKEARGEYLAFLDADCIPASDWLCEGLRSLGQDKCVTGAVCGIPDEAGWMERAWFAQKKTGRIESKHINSGNLFISRSLFLELGGFNEMLSSGEDYELCCRAKSNAKIISDDKIRVVHLGNPKTLKEFIVREIWHGMGALSSLRHSWFDKPLLGTIAFTLFYIMQLAGLIALICCGSILLFICGTIGLVSVLSLTVLYRIRTGASMKDAHKLLVLYYLYFFGRMLALVMLLIGKNEFQRTR